jgi:hypothetical protein
MASKLSQVQGMQIIPFVCGMPQEAYWQAHLLDTQVQYHL